MRKLKEQGEYIRVFKGHGKNIRGLKKQNRKNKQNKHIRMYTVEENSSPICSLVKSRLQGSSTVELSLLMPLLLTLFVFLIYLSFFLYNRVETSANAYICALRGSRMEQEAPKATYQLMKKESAKLMKESLLAVKGYKEQIEVKGNQVQVTYEISQQVPAALIFDSLFHKDTWEFQVTKKTKKLHPVSFIRSCRKLSGIKNEKRKEGENEGNL